MNANQTRLYKLICVQLDGENMKRAEKEGKNVEPDLLMPVNMNVDVIEKPEEWVLDMANLHAQQCQVTDAEKKEVVQQFLDFIQRRRRYKDERRQD